MTAATDWTPFELLAAGWEQHIATMKKAGIKARGVELCAKQLRETIALAKAEDEDAHHFYDADCPCDDCVATGQGDEPEPGGATSAWEHHR